MLQLNTIYNEDNLITLERMPDDTLDMSLTSPPYGTQRAYGGFSFDLDTMSSLLLQKTKEGGVCVWVIGSPTYKGSESVEPFLHVLKFIEAGWKLNDTMIFAKNNPMPGDCGPRYRQCFEHMFVFSKGKPKTFNPIMEATKSSGKSYQSFRADTEGRASVDEGVRVVKEERRKGNIFYYNVGTASSTDKLAFEHPAIFPEKLAEDQIKTWTNESDTVYDPFAGSNTTGKMCKLLDRNWIASEISEEYCQLAEKRLAF